MNYLQFSEEKLSVDKITHTISGDMYSFFSIFVGTANNIFGTLNITAFELETCEAIALKALERLCSEIREKWETLGNIAICHRIGEVPVHEINIVIAVSSTDRLHATLATQWCLENIEKYVPVWKKEICTNGDLEFIENEHGLAPKRIKQHFEIQQEVEFPYVAPHLIQIKATNEEIEARIEKFIERKREEINLNNVAEFCNNNKNPETVCSRVDAVFKKRKDSKSHLEVKRILNPFYRDQWNLDYLTKYMPQNGVEERLQNLESQLSLTKPTPGNIYKRLKSLEDRMLVLESISPEYIQFWDKTDSSIKTVKKKIFSIDEIDGFISDLEKQEVKEKR